MTDIKITFPIPADDPLVPYIIHSAKVWGTKDFAYCGVVEPADEHLFNLAVSYLYRDMADDMVTKIEPLLNLSGMKLDWSKWGGSPGGLPVGWITAADNEDADYVIFGMDEVWDDDGNFIPTSQRWYVVIADEYDPMKSLVNISWDDVTPEGLASAINDAIAKVRGS